MRGEFRPDPSLWQEGTEVHLYSFIFIQFAVVPTGISVFVSSKYFLSLSFVSDVSQTLLLGPFGPIS